jgi:hypothetical protein
MIIVRITEWYRLEEINDDRVFELLEYCREHGIDQLELEIFSPGGSVQEAWEAPIAEAFRRKLIHMGFKLPTTGETSGWSRNDRDFSVGVLFHPSRKDLLFKRFDL